MPDTVRIPVLQARGPNDPSDAALFSHWGHVEYQCYACHPAVFPKRKEGFTHAAMDAGRYCGHCHNGVQAWGIQSVQTDCERCHVPTKPPEEIDIDDLFGTVTDPARREAVARRGPWD